MNGEWQPARPLYYGSSSSLRTAAIFHEAQPAERKRAAQCASTGRTTVPYPAPGRGGRTVRRRLLTPRSGAGPCAHPRPTAARRGLLSFALRARRRHECRRGTQELSLIHISEPTRLGMISYAVF